MAVEVRDGVKDGFEVKVEVKAVGRGEQGSDLYSLREEV